MTAKIKSQVSERRARVRKELRKAGVSTAGLLRFTHRHLHTLVGQEERIHAVVYGRHQEAKHIAAMTEGLFVATNQRIIHLDHRPGFTAMDEIAYEDVSEIVMSTVGPYESMTVVTQTADYTVPFARRVSMVKFARYVGGRRQTGEPSSYELDETSLRFLSKHKIAALFVMMRPMVEPASAAVPYTMSGGYIYTLLSPSAVIAAIFRAELIVSDEKSRQSLCLYGAATVETNNEIKASVLTALTRQYKRRKNPLRLTDSQKKDYVIVRIAPERSMFTEVI